ncbi:lactonase family protein [Neobacillus pocheonensis]|uniref:Lactonase family protein n=1 Tax=Neobacillus pocheonensis TaxID=363869 RepID=A0ABT0W822_9BACI|nr:lactonase family protein [Neobacillus pocheonensis]
MISDKISKEVNMFAYVGCRTSRHRNARGKGINEYRVDPISGDWTHVQLVEDLVNPSFLAFDRNKNFLYTVHGDCSDVSAFHLDKKTDLLTFINHQSPGGKNPVHLVVDLTNKFLDGSLGEICDLILKADATTK